MAQDIYVIRAQVFKALSHPTRLKIIDVLRTEDEICVCDIAEELDVDQPSISKHLSTLRNAGIVTSRKEGLMVMYRLKVPCVREFFNCVDNIVKEDIKNKFRHLAEG